jgi:hypothetical protein
MAQIVNFTKLSSGDWGIKANYPLEFGRLVRVVKASGETSVVGVGSLVFSAVDEQIYVYQVRVEARSAARVSAPRATRRPCGYPGCTGGKYHCDQCS